MTTNNIHPRLGASCGALFALGLFVASSGKLYAVGLAALALFLPFLAYLSSLLRQAEGENGWLASTAFAGGIAGITLKLGSIAPEIARMRGIAHGTTLYKALDNIAGGATIISLWGFAVLVAAVAVLTIRTTVLPRWIGFGAGVTAVALAVNGGFVHAQFVPAFLLFLLWTLIASIVLFRRASREPAHAPRVNPATAA